MTTDNRYTHSKIYKLIDITTGVFYIGSTALTRLDQRLNIHKKASKNEKHKLLKVYQYFTYDKLCSGDVKIILLQEEFLNNKQELLKLENEYIIRELNNPLCVNTYRAYVSPDVKKKEMKDYMEEHKEYFQGKHHEYYINNKAKVLERQKKRYEEKIDEIKEQRQIYYKENREDITEKHMKYWAENAEKINAKRKEKITCECGTVLSKWNISKHIKRKAHQNFLLNNTNASFPVLFENNQEADAHTTAD